MFGLKGPNMEIASLKLKNHPILHDLELNFCDKNGKPHKNIVFAGENGTGKTTLLELINSVVGNMQVFLLERHKFDLTMEVRFSKEEQVALKEALGAPTFSFDENIDMSVMVLTYSKPISDHQADNYSFSFSNKIYKHLASKRRIAKFCRSVYSNAGMDFDTQSITSITSSQIDVAQDVHEPLQNSSSPMKLKQVLIDISAQDNDDFCNWARLNPKAAMEDYTTPSRMFRFSSAFHKMFDKISFKGIETQNAQKQVVFEKADISILLEELSSGEKQIVFRGGCLLKNIGILDGTVILVDEPEISMHPRWQRKIFSFYSDLFKTETEQKSQIFFATHSEYVLKDAMDKKAQIIVLTEQENAVKAESVNNKFVLPFGPTYAEIKYFAFNIPTIEFHDELYGYIQEKNGREKENEMEEFLKTNGVKQEKPWSRLKDGVFKSVQKLTLMTYIRNFYHHPEASRNERNLLHPLEPSDEEMRQSIDCMINILQG